MHAFDVDQLLADRLQEGQPYNEFLRVPDISTGLYVLPAGGEDPQGPHKEDEVYHVLSGKALLRVGDQDLPVEAGSIVYVEADLEHRFHAIEEAITTLVFFAPAESA